MDFLKIDDNVYEVISNNASREEPERGGTTRRTADGTLRSTVAWEKHTWNFSLAPMTIAEAEDFDTLTANGAILLCEGNVMPTDGRYAEIRVTGVQYIPIPFEGGTADDHMRLLTIKIVEA